MTYGLDIPVTPPRPFDDPRCCAPGQRSALRAHTRLCWSCKPRFSHVQVIAADAVDGAAHIRARHRAGKLRTQGRNGRLVQNVVVPGVIYGPTLAWIGL